MSADYPLKHQRCSECPRKGPVVYGQGPRNADVVFVGDAPDKDSNETKTPLVGKAGREFDRNYLSCASLSRSSVFVTNAVACFPANGGKAPSEKLVAGCSAFHLRRDLEQIKPRFVVPMGAVAGSVFGVKSVDMQYGIPFTGYAFGKKYKVVPMLSPSMGLFKTGSMSQLREGFESLGRVLDGTYKRAVDPGKGRVKYAELRTGKDVAAAFEDRRIAIDTETTGGLFDPPYCLTFSQNETSGYMIRMTNKNALAMFNRMVQRLKKIIYIHNSLFDLGVLLDMGIEIPISYVDDTMHRAYHLGNVPKGLKALAFRLCGIKMKDFDDVVTPYWVPRVVDWLTEAYRHEWGKPEKVWAEDKVKGRYQKQPQGMNQKIKRLLNDYLNSDFDIEKFDRISDWGTEMNPVIAKIGEVPRKSIIHVPFEEQLEYACTDSRATWFLGEVVLPELKEKLYTKRLKRKGNYGRD